MGKPYQTELDCLPETYNWALSVEISRLTMALAASVQQPMVAVGSGGSLSVAEYVASLHQHFANRLAKATTPLEVLSLGKRRLDSAFFLFSAGGSNKDTLHVFKHLSVLEPHRLVIMTARVESLVGKLADNFSYVDKIELPVPCGKDGFLATNSLLAFCVVMARAYEAVFNVPQQIPRTLGQLLQSPSGVKAFRSDLERRCSPLWLRENLVVLHSPALASAARDIESRFTEAALGPVQTADYRHFAHGRHHWLAKRGDSTAVLSLATEADSELAMKTLRLLPSGIPVLRLSFDQGLLTSALQALCTGIFVAGLAGKARGIDPGRPGVPPFGRKIYNLGPVPRRYKNVSSQAAVAVERKLACIGMDSIDSDMLELWNRHYYSFISTLKAQIFHGLVLDYDGTLCDDHRRFVGPDTAVTKAIVRVLRHGIPLGIATGRGDSVRQDLRRCIPSSLHRNILVGYYNGSQIGLLNDDAQPARIPTAKPLTDFMLVLERDAQLQKLAKCSATAFQISIRPKATVSLECVWSLLAETKERIKACEIRFVRSAHSIDVVTQDASKHRVLEALRRHHHLDANAPLLCIGDRGRLPGNDYELLSVPSSLSVDEVSTSPETCWNLASLGHRGTYALLDYFAAFRFRGANFQVEADGIGDATT